MRTGIEKLFISFVLLLLCHALLLMTRESVLGEFTRGWVPLALCSAGLAAWSSASWGWWNWIASCSPPENARISNHGAWPQLEDERRGTNPERRGPRPPTVLCSPCSVLVLSMPPPLLPLHFLLCTFPAFPP